MSFLKPFNIVDIDIMVILSCAHTANLASPDTDRASKYWAGAHKYYPTTHFS